MSRLRKRRPIARSTTVENWDNANQVKYVLDKLAKPQAKVILNYLGMPITEVPDNSKQLDELLWAAYLNERNELKEAYEIVVLHQVPGAGSEPRLVDYKILGDVVEQHINTYEDEAISTIKSQAIVSIENIDRTFNKLFENVPSMVDEQIKKAAEQFKVIKVQVGTSKPKQITGTVSESFEKVLQLAQERINILLVGPAGCGKTHMAAQVAEAMGVDYAAQSCTAGMSESMLTGWLLPTEAGGKFSYVSSEFVRIYENGGVFLFDEIDAADPNVLVIINQALANDGFFIPQRFDKPYVKKHKDFIAIGAANTFGGGADAMYHARNALDMATIDRFKIGMIGMDYSPTIEAKLVNPNILQWGLKVRAAIGKHKLRRLCSTRVLRDATKMFENQSWTLEQIKSNFFADWSREEMALMKMEGVA